MSASKDGAFDNLHLESLRVGENQSWRRGISTVPRLPPEIVERIIAHLGLPCMLGDPLSNRTLNAFALVNRLCRHWALREKYDTVILPRHVRDFRQWYSKMRGGYPSYEAAGYTRCFFVALDDVSRLTTSSAGWEAELLRLLHHLGPHLTHLSLWHAESRALLRDPAQVRGPRYRNRAPVHSLEDAIESTMSRRKKVERGLAFHKRMRGDGVPELEGWGVVAQGGIRAGEMRKTDREADDGLARSEVAAAKERARQTMPNWLRAEIERENTAVVSSMGKEEFAEGEIERRRRAAKAEAEIRRRYKAHVDLNPREYVHERKGASVTQGRQSKEEVDDDVASTTSESSDEGSERSVKDTPAEPGDYFLEWGCMPTSLSICASLPLYEHEEPLNFARMTIWTRVRELDVFISVPAQVPQVIRLFSSLVGSPLRRLRFSSVYASLVIALGPFNEEEAKGLEQAEKEPEVNLCKGLQAFMKSEALSSSLQHEFTNQHIEDVGMLERALKFAILSDSKGDPAFDDGLRKGRGHGLSSTLTFPDAEYEGEIVRVKVIQTNQNHWGKLKDRKEDFIDRALGGQGAWQKLGVWDA